jgi:radical SAM superfamily enzyme YgiQ (UPF0313 family)
MKKVLLVYPGYIVREQPLNILYIGSAVKAAGHAVALFEISSYRRRPLRGDPYRIIKESYQELCARFKPDVVGFSVMSVNYRIALELAQLTKRRSPTVRTVFGGIHPTIAPEETISEGAIDAICRGEGEASFTEFLAALDRGGDYTRTPGFWTKRDGAIFRNPMRPLIEDLDKIPFPDRDLISPSRLQAELYGVNLLTSRGCPFPCSYCQNEYLMDLYRGYGRFIRYRSIENVFAEIDQVLQKYHPSRLSFSDESFTLNKKRLEEFCERYAKRYSIPFLCQTRPDLIDENTIRTLKDGGCDFINMAIEAGNPRIRNSVLQRNITDEQIVQAFELARRHGIRTGSFNMIGLPGEDLSTVWDTIRINKLLQPDRIMCTVYMPFLGTKLGADCLKDGWLEHPIDDAEIYYTNITIKHPTISGRTLFGYQGFFDYYVRLSPKLYPLIHLLRWAYQLLPKTSFGLPSLLRAAREGVINFVYNMKRILPSRGFFMKTR